MGAEAPGHRPSTKPVQAQGALQIRDVRQVGEVPNIDHDGRARIVAFRPP